MQIRPIAEATIKKLEPADDAGAPAQERDGRGGRSDEPRQDHGHVMPIPSQGRADRQHHRRRVRRARRGRHSGRASRTPPTRCRSASTRPRPRSSSSVARSAASGKTDELAASLQIATGTYTTLAEKLEQLRINERLESGPGRVVSPAVRGRRARRRRSRCATRRSGSPWGSCSASAWRSCTSTSTTPSSPPRRPRASSVRPCSARCRWT